jgi:general secretion pathway protein A
MYENFFNLKHKPFELVPDPEYIYMSKIHKKAFSYLRYGIIEKAGFILVTGEVGSGKTTLLRTLLNNLDSDVVTSKIMNTSVESLELLAMVCEDFGVTIRKDEAKYTILQKLNLFLLEQFADDRQCILIIDEAQNLDAKSLEEIRLLSNLETEKSKLLQIILIGQPELNNTLRSPRMRQLRQRMSVVCHLHPLAEDDIKKYIAHRIQVASTDKTNIRINSNALLIIYKFSKGIPRLINIIMDFSLLNAMNMGTYYISEAIVQEVVGDLEINRFWDEDPGTEHEKVSCLVFSDPELQGNDNGNDKVIYAVHERGYSGCVE